MAYNRRQQTLVKKSHKKRKSILGQTQVSVAEESKLNIKREKIIELLEDGIYFSQETLDKSRREENDVKKL